MCILRVWFFFDFFVSETSIAKNGSIFAIVITFGVQFRVKPYHYGEEYLLAGTLYVVEYTPATYRTRDGESYYQFRYIDIGGKFEIDILFQPMYGTRDASLGASHRLPSSRGGHKICITEGHEPQTIENAKKISIEWSELTNTYIKTGRSIDSQVEANART